MCVCDVPHGEVPTGGTPSCVCVMYLMERFLQAGRQMTVHLSTAMAAIDRDEIRMNTA